MGPDLGCYPKPVKTILIIKAVATEPPMDLSILHLIEPPLAT